MIPDNTKSIGELATNLVTAIKAPSTKGEPQTTIFQRFKRIAEFQTFNDPQLERMLTATATFAASVNFTRPYWLTLAGNSGLGKTHLAKKVQKQFYDQNRFAIAFDSARFKTFGNTMAFWSWRELCGFLRSGAYECIESICDEWFVILDDIGSERDTTGFIADATDRIFNGRKGKWTMITTNLGLQDIAEKLDQRIADRMLRDDGVVIECNTESYSLRKNK